MAIAIDGAESQAYSHINMRSLIDVMLVLLTIFIITLPNQTHAVKIENPPPSMRTTEPAVINRSIDFDGPLIWNNHLVYNGAA